MLSFRDIEDLLAERGVMVSYESIRLWCQKFGSVYARRLRKRAGLGDTRFMDEIMITTVLGERCYLWRAVDQDNQVIDILVQKHKDTRAAARFFKKMLKDQGRTPRRMVTDKLRSYGAARNKIMPSAVHDQDRYANNCAEAFHQALDNRSGRCADSNQRDRHSGFSLCMVRCTTSSEWVVT